MDGRDGTRPGNRTHESRKLRRGKQCWCEVTAWLLGSDRARAVGVCPGDHGSKASDAGNLDGTSAVTWGPPPRGNRQLGRLDQKGKHRNCAGLRLDGTRATLPPDSEFQDHFRILIACWESWDCNPKPVVQRPAPTSHSAHHCRANLGTDSKWHCTFMRDRKPGSARKASIHPESAAAAGRQPSEHSEQTQEGTGRQVGTLQAAQRSTHSSARSTACSVALLVQALRASSQFQNLLFAVYD